MKLPFNVPKEISVSFYHDPAAERSVLALKLLKQCAVKNKFNITLVQAKYVPPPPGVIADIAYFLGNGSTQKGLSSILIPQVPIPNTLEELLATLNKNPSYLRKPLVVDWRHGKAMVVDPPETVIDFVKNIGVKRESKGEK